MDLEDLIVVLIARRRQRRKRRQRRYWVHPLKQLRESLGEEVKVHKMYKSYPDLFFQYTRMTPAIFDILLGFVEPKIAKQNTNYRSSISARTRLYVTLRFLATGDSIRTIATSFSMGLSTVWTIISEALSEIWNVMSPIYLKLPSKGEWNSIVDDFQQKWNFPNCFGAIDGKHVVITAPPNSGSLFHNYKGTFSIVLLATSDANYNFTLVDVGAYGRQSDGGIFGMSAFGKGLIDGSLDIPDDRPLPGTNITQPCTLVGDDAFGLSTFMMKPYPDKGVVPKRRIFNYRLSRARRIIENCFGILVSRFRLFQRRLFADVDQATKIVKASVVLHNFIRKEEEKLEPSARVYCPPGYVDSDDNDNGGWRNEVGGKTAMTQFRNGGSNNYTVCAKKMRDTLADYFVSATGSVSWQNERAII